MIKIDFIKWSIAIIVMLLSISCKDKASEMPFLTVDVDNVNFDSQASQRAVSVKTNASEWTASVANDAKSWLSASPSGSSLSISVTKNDEKSAREGKITVSAGTESKTLTVQQLGVEPAILVSSEIFTLNADGGQFDLDVTSNIEYDVVIEDADEWIEKLPTSRAADMVTTSFAFEVAWSSLEAERKGNVLIKQKNGSLEKRVMVLQKARGGYEGSSKGDIKDDIKVGVSRATASSAQQGEGIEKSIDGDYNTIYHSAWNNSAPDYFPITLDYFFDNQESIDYLVYHPRREGSNGFFKEVEIWVTTKEKPTLTKLMDFDFKGSSAATRVNFEKPLVNPTCVRFVVKSGYGDNQGFASCAEMEFFRTNPDNFDPLTLFTDVTCSQLKPGVTEEEISKVTNNLYRNIAHYIYNGTYPAEFRIQDYKAWPNPVDWATVNKTNPMSLLDNPTGISVSQGEELIVFVGDTHGQSISLLVQNLNKPGGDGFRNGASFPLVKGVNKLQVPNKGLAYIFYHTSDYETAKPIRIHIATGKVNGYFDSQKHKPEDWPKYLAGAVDEYFDILGEYAHATFPTADFRANAASNGPELVQAYDDLVRMEMEFMGLMKYNRPMINRAYFHAMYHSYMYATHYHTGYNISDNDIRSLMTTVGEFKRNCWGPAHEQGHMFQTRPGFLWKGMTEVTNNLHSLHVQTEWGNPSRLESESMGRYNNRYEKAYNSSFVSKTSYVEEDDVFCKLVSLWQLHLYYGKALDNPIYKDYYEMVRTSPNLKSEGERQLDFVRMMCEVTKTDLTDFFKKWGYLTPVDKEIDDYGVGQVKITQEMINILVSSIKMKGYPTLKDKMEYICDSNWEIFKKRLPIQKGTATKSGKTIRMTNWKNVVAYEVYEGNTLKFVSNQNTFTLDADANANTKVYAIAFDGNKTEVQF